MLTTATGAVPLAPVQSRGGGGCSAGEGPVGCHPVCSGHRACGGGVGRDRCPRKSLGENPSSPLRLAARSPQHFLASGCVTPVSPCPLPVSTPFVCGSAFTHTVITPTKTLAPGKRSRGEDLVCLWGRCNSTHCKRGAGRSGAGSCVLLCGDPTAPPFPEPRRPGEGCPRLTALASHRPLFSYCGCRAPGPAGFAKIKLHHLPRVPHPRSRLLRGSGEHWSRWGVLDLHKVPFAWRGAEGIVDRLPRSGPGGQTGHGSAAKAEKMDARGTGLRGGGRAGGTRRLRWPGTPAAATPPPASLAASRSRC